VRVRIALALMVVVAAALAYPWQTTIDWWVLGVAGAVLIGVAAWWRGHFLTALLGRRVRVWRRNRNTRHPAPAHKASVTVRVEDPAGVGLSLPLVAGYVDRFGVRCDKVAVATRDGDGTRTTWITLTVDAEANMVALQARSRELPLRDTAEIAARRLADHLRETGLTVAIADEVVDGPVAGGAREKWRCVIDEVGAVSAYGIRVDGHLAERLAELRAQGSEMWSVLEFGGTAARLTAAAACAVRTSSPVRGVPVQGLIAQPGNQGPMLTAIRPGSAASLGVPATSLGAAQLADVDWPVGADGALSRT
jgi:type VII secretion protein EccE